VTTKIQIKVKQQKEMSEKKDKKQDNSYLVDFSICKERLLKKQVLKIEQIEMKALNESHFKT